MTEAEWLAATDPTLMLESYRDGMSYRKLRLFAVACCRQVWDDLYLECVRELVDLNELFAEGQIHGKELATARNTAHGPTHEAWNKSRSEGNPTGETIKRLFFAVFMAKEIQELRWDKMPLLRSDPVLLHTSPGLLRCINGNPFHPITLDPSWLTSTVVSLANQMYDTKDFSAMPILADALQDSSCDNEAILTHCRGPGPHVRGCWVIDLLTNRE